MHCVFSDCCSNPCIQRPSCTLQQMMKNCSDQSIQSLKDCETTQYVHFYSEFEPECIQFPLRVHDRLHDTPYLETAARYHCVLWAYGPSPLSRGVVEPL